MLRTKNRLSFIVEDMLLFLVQFSVEENMKMIYVEGSGSYEKFNKKKKRKSLVPYSWGFFLNL